jgi:hypothetical protein
MDVKTAEQQVFWGKKTGFYQKDPKKSPFFDFFLIDHNY